MNNITKEENIVEFFQTESIVHAQEGYHGEKKTCHQNIRLIYSLNYSAEFTLSNNLHQIFTLSFTEVKGRHYQSILHNTPHKKAVFPP